MSDLPNEDILWKIDYIRREGWANMLAISNIKDLAEQLEWYDLIDWIEEEVEIGSGHNFDSETWIGACQAASKTYTRGERETLECGGAITVPTSDTDDPIRS